MVISSNVVNEGNVWQIKLQGWTILAQCRNPLKLFGPILVHDFASGIFCHLKVHMKKCELSNMVLPAKSCLQRCKATPNLVLFLLVSFLSLARDGGLFVLDRMVINVICFHSLCQLRGCNLCVASLFFTNSCCTPGVGVTHCCLYRHTQNNKEVGLGLIIGLIPVFLSTVFHTYMRDVAVRRLFPPAVFRLIHF